MRLFMTIALIVCVLSIALFFYLEHDTKKFIKNLPSPPISTKDQESETADVDADSLSITPPVLESQDPQRIVDEGETSPDIHHAGHVHQHEHPPPLVNDTGISQSKGPPRATETESNMEKPLKTVLQKPLEGLKKKLIEEHGDIPLVHTYIELRRKELNREEMTMDEVSTLWDAIMVFNPTPENRKTYEIIKQLSSEADPGTFRVIYDPPEQRRARGAAQ